jgi:iron(III) transport system ATP-binding protein
LGLTTIFVTHDQEEAMTTADRMAVLDQGVVQQVGPPATLYDYPANTFIAGFVGTANMLQGEVRARQGGALTLHVKGIGDLAFPTHPDLPQSSAMTVSFRPQTLRMEVADAMLDGRYLWMPGRVASNEFLGEYSRYHVDVGGHLVAVDQPHHTGLSKFPVGASVSIGIEPSQVRLFAA